MEIRKDLESVSSYVARLLYIGQEFKQFNREWSCLKNQEDFIFVSRIPIDERYKIEALYAEGRDMAIYMCDALLSINNDFSRYPTLTSITELFNNSWVYGNYNKEVPSIAKLICDQNQVNLWSVNQMVALFRKQEDLLTAVRVTLNLIRESDLYKMENGIPVIKQEANINVVGVTGSSVNINSSGATAITKNYSSLIIFNEIVSAIKESTLDSDVKSNLIDNVRTLEAGHQNGSFKEAYKEFMQNVANHVTIFAPFLPSLAFLL